MALEGPYGDHTGYYNEQAEFPVFTIERITMRENPIYHSTYTGKPPDEPAMLGVALNEVFVPLLQKQYPEIVDFYLPPEGCSYRHGHCQHQESSTPATPSASCSASGASCASSCTPSSSSWWMTTSTSATGRK